MIADLDETIRQLLIAELPAKNGEIDFSFDQPNQTWSAKLNRPTVNLFLYDLRENAALRQHMWERRPDNRQGSNGSQVQLKRTPIRVDCFYMLTVWAADPEDEHRLLSRCLQALFRYPVLPAERLIGDLKTQPYEIQARLGQHDKLTNPAEVWSALDNQLRPSISYILTLALDPWQEVSEPVVRSRTLRYGQAEGLLGSPRLELGTISELIEMGGTVKDAAQNGKPVAGVPVAIKGTGIFTTSDEGGRFTLGSLPPGRYTLVAWSKEGTPREKQISLPAGDGDYDIEL